MFLHQTRHTNSMDQSFCLYFSRQMPFITKSRVGRYPNNKPLRSKRQQEATTFCLRLGCDDMSRFKWIVTLRVVTEWRVTSHNMTIIMFLSQSQGNYNVCHSNFTPIRAHPTPAIPCSVQNKGSVAFISFKYFPGWRLKMFPTPTYPSHI